jgi:hypothetical protein
MAIVVGSVVNVGSVVLLLPTKLAEVQEEERDEESPLIHDNMSVGTLD